MLTHNPDFVSILKSIAISLDAQSVSLIDNKKYRFYLSDKRTVDIPKKELELEYLRDVKLDVMQ